MKKSAVVTSILFSGFFSVAATFTASTVFADSQYKSIRILSNSDQFASAVENDKVVIGLPHDLMLSRKKTQALASKRIETITKMHKDDGTSQDLVVSCKLEAPTKNLKYKVVSTKGTTNPWHVQNVKRITDSKETWTLGRDSSKQIQLTCHSFIFSGDKVKSEVSLTPSMVHRVLGEIGGSVLTSVADPAQYSNPQDYNVGLVGPTGVGSAASNTVQ